MDNISDRAIGDSLRKYGVTPTGVQCRKIRSYISLLLKWNRSISLTTVTDVAGILKFHFGESVFGLRAIRGIENGRLADVGAGAGFPGIPLRIFAPYLQLLLIESNAKKCVFLSEVVRALELENVQVMRSQFKELEESGTHFDIIAARALGRYEELLEWSGRALSPTGRMALWLGVQDAGKLSTSRAWKWKEPIQIPGSNQRVILAGVPDVAFSQNE